MNNFWGTPVITSAHGLQLDKLTWYIHGLMLALFVGWLVYFVYVLFRFRQSRRPQADHLGVRNHFSTWVEVGVAVVEAVLLIGFAVPLWSNAVDKFPSEKDATVIEISARQFNWTARYAGPDGIFGRKNQALASSENPWGIDKTDPNSKDDITVVNDLVAPVNKPIIAIITSMDVIHSFALRTMRVTQDAIPGMVIPIHFTPITTGTMAINCAQLCGNSHYAMKGNFTVTTQEEFATWLKSKAQSAGDATGFE